MLAITSVPGALERLEKLSREIIKLRDKKSDADATVAKLKPKWNDARHREHKTKQDLRNAEREIFYVRRIVGVVNARAALELDVGDDLNPLIIQPAEHEFTDPRHWELVAIGSEGTGLYLHVPKRSHRYEGKVHARTRYKGDDKLIGTGADFAKARVREVPRTDLITWQERGKGDWGEGTGSIKPKTPPEGGRWRWLKTEDYLALPAGEEE